MPTIGAVTTRFANKDEVIAALSAERIGEVMASSIVPSPSLGEGRRQLQPRVEELVSRAKRAGAMRPGIEASDLVVTQLMLAAIPVADGEETWRRFLPVVLDGLSADPR